MSIWKSETERRERLLKEQNNQENCHPKILQTYLKVDKQSNETQRSWSLESQYQKQGMFVWPRERKKNKKIEPKCKSPENLK